MLGMYHVPLLERRNWHMSNIGIPGFWPHVALYVGTLEQMDKFFADVELPAGETASEYIAARFPDAWELLKTRDEHGFQRCIIEAVLPGVALTALEISGNADYLAVVRPRISKRDIFDAIIAAFTHHGKPYDYNFDFATENARVCSELVYKAFQSAQGLTLTPEVISGRIVLTPNAIVAKFDSEYGTPEQQLDFVLFLEGREKDRSVTARSVDDFRSTWKREKWDVVQE